ncbi:putative high-affinity nicotinic acid transporter protein [Colletotrichum karsti]|uniref:High-affinity nicotinic acid transporter protein n=1 Tax=Colletotrichum karsti TaxID=1095194 RepID=A0A9P6LQU4_9PEZI|nr:putative high-affinity nicotinic acid transporter protein [Colletotrichum karsti]KAF9882166.1 putative high-affinity nicotinic acid transporter protein [Colletotrichum karsti]
MESQKDDKDLAVLDVTDSVKHTPLGVDTIRIDPQLEKAALKKFDKFLLPVAFLFMLLSSLDRSNIGNARVFGFDEDVGLHGRQFGDINTLFFVTFIVFETPWVMAVKRWGPNKVLGIALVSWSVVTLCTGFIHSYAAAIVTRMLLGACEAGVSPSFAFIFATIYDRSSTAKRIAMGNICNTVAGAFGGLFAYGIQMMGSQRGIAAWRWLFIIEGSVTLVVGGIGWMFLPSSPETAWYLTIEEKEVMVLRKQKNMAFRGEDGFDKKWIKLAFTDPFIYIAGAAFFTSSVAITGFSIFLPTIIKGLGYASLKVNYMTIPVYVAGALSLLVQAYFSDKLHMRAPFLVGSAIPVAVGYLICVGTSNPAAGYFGMFLLAAGCYTISTIVVTWVATNLMPDSKRSVALPVFYSIGNMSGLVSSQLYPSYHAPRYVMGNALSAGLELVFVGFVAAAWLLLRKRNAEKEKLTAEGATTNGLEGDMALGFEYCL